MGRFEKHINKGIEVEIENSEGEIDKIIIKSPGSEYLPQYFTLMKSMGDIQDSSDPSNILSRFDDKTVIALKELIEGSLRASYPTEPESELKEFAMKNFMVLVPVVIESLTPVTKNSSNIAKIEALKARIANQNGPVQTDKG
jgi:hypothetical protein